MTENANSLPEAATITVSVFVPADPTPKTFTWPRSLTVGEAATEAAQEFGFVSPNPTFLNSDEEILDREKPLAAAGVKDGDKLELVDIGGGV